MKKIALIVLSLLLVRCSDDSSDIGAEVRVKVVNALDAPVIGTTVYMFREVLLRTEADLEDALETRTTDRDGNIDFVINFHEMEVVEGETEFYFTVFYSVYEDSFFENSEGVTVRAGDRKELTIRLPI